MNNRETFRKLIKECLAEVRQESSPKSTLKESLRGVVKQVLKEIANVKESGPSPYDKDEHEKISKGYAKGGNERESDSNDKRQEEIESIVHAIDPTWTAYWDDHGQLIVRAHNMLYVRIVPKFENNYDVDAMVKLVDRVRAIAQTWEQVKAFVKENFKNLKSKNGNKTIPDKEKDRAMGHYEDRDVIKKAAGPEHDIVKNRGEKNNGEDSKLKTTKRDDQNYKKDAVEKDEDQPDQPMKQVTEPGKDPKGLNKNIEKTKQIKPPKHEKSSTDLRASDKKTTKFRAKKS